MDEARRRDTPEMSLAVHRRRSGLRSLGGFTYPFPLVRACVLLLAWTRFWRLHNICPSPFLVENCCDALCQSRVAFPKRLHRA
ncbi:hypothetical protein BD309DRAFT_954027 [Dichomitus squalens]|nr:hypothetical protein BD309DRAFT_954027 [Dichomitus squalens]